MAVNFMLFDGLRNLVSGVGTDKDKASHWKFHFRPITMDEIDNAYATDWLGRKIVDIPPKDMTREWRTWEAKQAEAIYAAEKTFKIRTKVRQSLTWARLYGGAAIMIVDGTDPAEPLDVLAIPKGGIKSLHAFASIHLSPTDKILDMEDENFGQPEFFTIRNDGVLTPQKIHRSRFVFFYGPEAPCSHAGMNWPWGQSIYETVLTAVMNVNSTAANAAALTEEAKVDVITVPDLHNHLSTEAGTSRMISRFTMANMLKSTINTLLLGAGETFDRKQTSFAGLTDLMRAHAEIASGAADVPLIRLFSQSPAGLNATGQADIRNYYDMLKSEQALGLTDTLVKLDDALIRHVLGIRPRNITYTWNPMWQLSQEELANIGLKQAQTSQIYVGINLFAPEELRGAVADQLISTGVYPTLDQHLLTEDDFNAMLQERAQAQEEQQAQLPPPDQGGGEGESPFGDSDLMDAGFAEFEPAQHPRGFHGRFSNKPDQTAATILSTRSEFIPLTPREVLSAAQDVSEKLGYDPSMIKIGAPLSPDREFTLSGQKYKATAFAYIKERPGDPPVGTIRIFPDGLSKEAIPGIVAHEVMHHKWQKVFEAYQAERKQVMEFDPGDKNFMKADGSLKSPYDKKFPLYSRFNPILENSTKLREEDGVSGYSKEWWADSQASVEQQYHETLAEIARSDFETDGEIFKPGKSAKFTHNFHWYQRVKGPWADLYHAVKETYEELKGRT